ncbi:MAG: hypothetical protein JNL75_10205 [Chitinophagales bacterium]|nr:hypothetical protein [Chitinophagales bacterium]
MLKFTRFTFIIFAVTLMNISHALGQGSAVEHMKTISEILEKSKDETFSYLKAITKGRSARKIENKRQNLLTQIRSEIGQIRGLGSYNGDNSLKEGCLVYLNIQKTILAEDYEKIINLEEIAEKSYDDLELYLNLQEKVNEKLQAASDSFDIVYKEFAAKYEITLIDGEVDKKSKRIKKMSETLDYYHEALLLQLKCAYQERKIVEALDKGDVNAAQQGLSVLTTIADENLVKLDALQPYEGDFSLIGATRKLINFFKREAEGDFTKMLDYHITKENFETVKKNFDAKSKSERDQEAIDEYNKAVNDMNAAVKTFNELINRVNKERANQNKAWEDVANEFNQNHSK